MVSDQYETKGLAGREEKGGRGQSGSVLISVLVSYWLVERIDGVQQHWIKFGIGFEMHSKSLMQTLRTSFEIISLITNL